MSITLSIIAHELEAYGSVIQNVTPDHPFEDVRLYRNTDSLNLDRADLIYLCDDPDRIPATPSRKVHLLYVGTPERPVAPGAACSFSGNAGILDVLAFLQGVFLKYREWERSLDASCLANEGIQQLLNLSEPFLRNNTVVVDPALKLLAHTAGIACDDPITIELINHGYHTEDNIRKFKLNKRFVPWATQAGFIVNETREICKYTTIVHSFKTRDSFSIIVIMMCNHADPAPYLYDTLSLLIKRIGFYVEREYPEGKPSGSSVDSFLRDLAEGNIDSQRSIMERCEFAGIPYQARFCLFHISSPSDSAPTPRLLADIAREVAPAKALIVGRAVVVLCFNCYNSTCVQHCQEGTCPHARKAVSRRLDDLLERYDMSCGRSSSFTELAQMRRAYLQAQAAERIGTAAQDHDVREESSPSLPSPHEVTFKKPPLKHIFPFDLYHFDHLISSCAEQDVELARMTNGCQMLARILESDARFNTDNYVFLYQYLINERRASVVAETLHMHRNNVKYRIDRIEKTFGIDTSNAQTRHSLIIAYAIDNAVVVRNAQ